MIAKLAKGLVSGLRDLVEVRVARWKLTCAMIVCEVCEVGGGGDGDGDGSGDWGRSLLT